MIRAAVLALTLCAGAALAQQGSVPAASECRFDPDHVTIADAGEGRAVVTYHNSAAGCSGGVNRIMITPAGVEVRVVITVNVDSAAERERIVVIPQTDGMFAFPPEAEIRDGETVEIIVMGGMA